MIFSRQIRSWIKASRLASQLYICTPLIVGQLYARLAGFHLDWSCLCLVQAFGLFIQLFIVYANDLADVETDRLNRTYTLYSGGSRVLVDGDLTSAALRRGAVLSASVALLCCVILGIAFGRWLLVPLGIVSILLLLVYSYPPVRLNYRGGGEILQVIGTGIVLPLFGWYAHSGSIKSFPLPCLVLLVPTMMACAIGTSLPDECSDRISGKHSVTVLLGQKQAQLTTILLHAVSLVILLILILKIPGRLSISIITIASVPFLLLLTQFGGSVGSTRLVRFGFSSIASTLVITVCSVGATGWDSPALVTADHRISYGVCSHLYEAKTDFMTTIAPAVHQNAAIDLTPLPEEMRSVSLASDTTYKR